MPETAARPDKAQHVNVYHYLGHTIEVDTHDAVAVTVDGVEFTQGAPYASGSHALDKAKRLELAARGQRSKRTPSSTDWWTEWKREHGFGPEAS